MLNSLRRALIQRGFEGMAFTRRDRNSVRTLFAHAFLCAMLSSTAQTAPLTRCNCEKAMQAKCEAGVERVEGWAKLISDTPQCSRVAWMVNGDERNTVVKDGATIEKLGVQDFDAAQLQVLSCTVCEDAKYILRNPSTPQTGTEQGSPFDGRWSGIYKGLVFTHNVVLNIKMNGNTLTGTWESGITSTAITGTVSGNKVNVRNFLTIPNRGTLTLKDSNTIEYDWSPGGSGILTKDRGATSN